MGDSSDEDRPHIVYLAKFTEKPLAHPDTRVAAQRPVPDFVPALAEEDEAGESPDELAPAVEQEAPERHEAETPVAASASTSATARARVLPAGLQQGKSAKRTTKRKPERTQGSALAWQARFAKAGSKAERSADEAGLHAHACAGEDRDQSGGQNDSGATQTALSLTQKHDASTKAILSALPSRPSLQQAKPAHRSKASRNTPKRRAVQDVFASGPASGKPKLAHTPIVAPQNSTVQPDLEDQIDAGSSDGSAGAGTASGAGAGPSDASPHAAATAPPVGTTGCLQTAATPAVPRHAPPASRFATGKQAITPMAALSGGLPPLARSAQRGVAGARSSLAPRSSRHQSSTFGSKAHMSSAVPFRGFPTATPMLDAVPESRELDAMDDAIDDTWEECVTPVMHAVLAGARASTPPARTLAASALKAQVAACAAAAAEPPSGGLPGASAAAGATTPQFGAPPSLLPDLSAGMHGAATGNVATGSACQSAGAATPAFPGVARPHSHILSTAPQPRSLTPRGARGGKHQGNALGKRLDAAKVLRRRPATAAGTGFVC
jgi:hypothetical protein